MTKAEQFSVKAKDIFAQENKTLSDKREEYNEFIKTQTIFKKLKKCYYRSWYWAVDYKITKFLEHKDFSEYTSWEECVKEFEDEMWNFRDYWNYDVLRYTYNFDYNRGEYLSDFVFIRIVSSELENRVKKEFEKRNKDLYEKEKLEKALNYIPEDSPILQQVKDRIIYLTKN